MFSRKVTVTRQDEDLFYDTVHEKMKKVWPTLSSYEVEILEVSLIEMGYVPAAYVVASLERQELTTVSNDYVFVQRWFVPNVWKWPETSPLDEEGVPIKDFPLNYDPSSADFKLLAWREKMDGVPYKVESNFLVGERKANGEKVRILVPPELLWIQFAERVGDTFYILYPYKKFVGEFESEGVHYNLKTHDWRTGRPQSGKEGLVFLTDRGEMRLKSCPTAEVNRDGQVWEVALRGQSLVNVRPRHTSKYRTESDAMAYLSRQPFERMYDIYIPEQTEIPASAFHRVSKSMDDKVVISGGTVQPGEEYANMSRVYTSAKALIQDRYGRFLLIKEGTKMWDLPGGKCNFLSEPPSHILRRELKEELGWEIPVKELFFKDIRYTESSIVFMYHFVVDPREITPQIFNGGEISEMCWFTVNDYLNLTQKEMVSWLPSLFNDIVTIDRGFVCHVIGDFTYRLLQRCKAGTIVTSPIEPTLKMDTAGNPIYKDGHVYRYFYPVIPGTGELWHSLETQMWPLIAGMRNGVHIDGPVYLDTLPPGQDPGLFSPAQLTVHSKLLAIFSQSDTFLYHELMRNASRLGGRQCHGGVVWFRASEKVSDMSGEFVTLDWGAQRAPWLNYVFYERAVTLAEIQKCYPEVSQPLLDQLCARGDLIVKRIGQWNYYSVP
jgi:ADP-ribose pyrophosphatase YjhB (NUDIX family)